MSVPVYTYRGYQYVPWDDVEPDNTKRWHAVIAPDGRRLEAPFNPYHHASFLEFAVWVELGALSDRHPHGGDLYFGLNGPRYRIFCGIRHVESLLLC